MSHTLARFYLAAVVFVSKGSQDKNIRIVLQWKLLLVFPRVVFWVRKKDESLTLESRSLMMGHDSTWIQLRRLFDR